MAEIVEDGHGNRSAAAAIVSDHHETEDCDSDAAEVCPDNRPDETFDAEEDTNNELWVYRHMRGGVVEVRSEKDSYPVEAGGIHPIGSESATDAINMADANASAPPRPDSESLRKLKPRNSDAVLSCPCCFTVVTMDCQRHVRYTNQYRAMFVMNIGVQWDRRLVYDEGKNELIDYVENKDGERDQLDRLSSSSTAARESERGEAMAIPSDESAGQKQRKSLESIVDVRPEIYHSVHCASCQTEVAALNMSDEIYHFFGCLASG